MCRPWMVISTVDVLMGLPQSDAQMGDIYLTKSFEDLLYFRAQGPKDGEMEGGGLESVGKARLNVLEKSCGVSKHLFAN